MEEVGQTLDHVVKPLFLSDMNDPLYLFEVYKQSLYYRVSSSIQAVEVARLPRDVKVEIEVIAEIKA